MGVQAWFIDYLARRHAISDNDRHSSTITPTKIIIADGNGLPTEGTNTNAQVASAVSSTHAAVTVSSPITLAGQLVGIQDATTTQKGAVQLEDSTSSTSTTKAATPNSVKTAYDLANGKVDRTGDTMTGDLTIKKATPTLNGRDASNNPTDLHLNTGAAKTVVFDTPTYDDLLIPLDTGKVPAVNFPTWTAFTTNTSAYTFAVDDRIDLQSTEALHSYQEGTDLSPHLHIAINGATVANRTVKFILYYTWANTGSVFSELSTELEFTIPASSDRQHYLLALNDISGAGKTIGSVIKTRLRRLASSGTELSNPFVLMVGFHFKKDTIGSRGVSSK